MNLISMALKKLFYLLVLEKNYLKSFIKKNTFNFDDLILFEETFPLGECGSLWQIRSNYIPKHYS